MQKQNNGKPFCMYNKTNISFLFSVLAICIFTSCASVKEEGKASYYADKFNGRKTASGSTFRQRKRTAAHRTLPFGTKLKVKNLDNGRTVHVKVTDRGPFVQGRMLDLSKKAARKLGMLQQGVANVEIRYKRKK